MKIYLTSLLIFAYSFISLAQDYSVTIDGQNFDINLDQEFTYITEGGDSVKFKVQSNGTVSPSTYTASQNNFQDQGSISFYDDSMISFSYPANFAIAKTQPANGMQQITMVSGDGGGIIVQEFSTLNPKDLIDFTLSHLVGENHNSTSVNHTLDGQKVKGKRSVDEDGNDVVVYSYGKKNQGVLIALFGNHENSQLLSTFLKEFRLKF